MLKIFEIEKKAEKKNLPEIRSGYTVRIQQKIREGDKERLQAFEGVVIKMSSGRSTNKTITIRKVVDGIGVEKCIPIHSPNVAKIEVTRKSKVRRSKLYFLREAKGKRAKLYEIKEPVVKAAA